MKKILRAAAGAVALAGPLLLNLPAQGAVPAAEAEQLKTTLTPLGGERKGNTDGTIPNWTGGYTSVPAAGDPHADPFAAEKPRLVITHDNYQSQASKLAAGTLELFKRNPDFKILVYPTHRTAAAPQAVYDATFRNAATAKTLEGGNAVTDAHGGIPFPIAKNGHEMMWNALLHWQGKTIEHRSRIYIITPDGNRALASTTDAYYQWPYYLDDPGALAGNYVTVVIKNLAPAYEYGQSVLAYNTLNPIRDGQPGWQYLVGQRRVRKAPSLQYDTPDFIVSGIINFDENDGFTGSLDRYDWKVLGKREIYVPYNTNKLLHLTTDQQLGPHFPNPDAVRWELHRVFVVEGVLAAGARHVVPRRQMFLDEDSWQILAQDEWDASGNLWKHQVATPFLLPEIPAVGSYTGAFIWISTAAVKQPASTRLKKPMTSRSSTKCRPTSSRRMPWRPAGHDDAGGSRRVAAGRRPARWQSGRRRGADAPGGAG